MATKRRKNRFFGQELILDLYGCELEIMQSKKKLRIFSEKICKLIKISRIGDPIIRKTGKGVLKGYSFCQFLETSSIVIHTCDPILEIHLNIFSCKPFNSKKATGFAREFFKPRISKIKNLIR